jgi:hypothetical protein
MADPEHVEIGRNTALIVREANCGAVSAVVGCGRADLGTNAMVVDPASAVLPKGLANSVE